jgi:hypothetical protein
MSSLPVLFLVFSGSECVVNTENLVLALVQTTIKMHCKNAFEGGSSEVLVILLPTLFFF